MTPKPYIAITGATTFIGGTTALRFARSGYRLVLIDEDAAALQAVYARIMAECPDIDIFTEAVAYKDREALAAMYDGLANFKLAAWIDTVAKQPALAELAMRFVRDHQFDEDAQLINVALVGEFMTRTTYSATKYYLAATGDQGFAMVNFSEDVAP